MKILAVVLAMLNTVNVSQEKTGMDIINRAIANQKIEECYCPSCYSRYRYIDDEKISCETKDCVNYNEKE